MKYFKVKQFIIIHGTVFIDINMWEHIFPNDITSLTVIIKFDCKILYWIYS